MIAEALFLRRERLCGARVAGLCGGDRSHERALEVHGEDRDEGRRAEVQDQAFRLWLQVAALSPMVPNGEDRHCISPRGCGIISLVLPAMEGQDIVREAFCASSYAREPTQSSNPRTQINLQLQSNRSAKPEKFPRMTMRCGKALRLPLFVFHSR